MEYQIRRDPNHGLFHIVFVNPQHKELTRVPGLNIEEQVKNCKTGVKKVPRELLQFCNNVNNYHKRNPIKKQVPWDLLKQQRYQPLSYQKVAIQLMYQNNRRINASEMGLGKTFEIIKLLQIMKAERISNLIDKTKAVHLFSLIILPPKLKDQWKDEIQKFAPELTIRIIEDAKTASFHPNVDIILLSDGLLENDNKEMIKKIITTTPDFSLLVVDEAHSMKNYASQRSKLMYLLSCHTSKLVLLTGTPHCYIHYFIHLNSFILNRILCLPMMRVGGLLVDIVDLLSAL